MSSNELQSLPSELCSLPSLRDLNVRRNQLSTLPDGEENEGVRVCVCVYFGGVTDKKSSRKSNALVAWGMHCMKHTVDCFTCS